MINMNLLNCFLLSSLVLINAAPMPLASQIEILRISGVSESDIEHTLNPNHIMASLHESSLASITSSSTSQHTLLLHHGAPIDVDHFAATIDGYSTAKLSPDAPTPASASLGNLAITLPVESSSEGAFERVRRWMTRRGSDNEDAMVVTGRMGDMKIRGR